MRVIHLRKSAKVYMTYHSLCGFKDADRLTDDTHEVTCKRCISMGVALGLFPGRETP